MNRIFFFLILTTIAITTGSCRKDDDEIFSDNVYVVNQVYWEYRQAASIEYNFYYDSLGRLIKEEFLAVGTVRWADLLEYDEDGNLRKVTIVQEVSIDDNTYDSTYYHYYYNSINGNIKLNSVVKEREGTDTSTCYYEYDERGMVSRVYDQYGEKIVETDEHGRIISVLTKNATTNDSVYYTWQNGNIIKVTNPSGNVKNFTYDNRPNVNLAKHLPNVLIQESCLDGKIEAVNKNNIIKKIVFDGPTNEKLSTEEYLIEYESTKFPQSITWDNYHRRNSYYYEVR